MSAALGIDIGSDKCVVATINSDGVVDVLQNEASKRETPTVIHFDRRQRLFGAAGAARAKMDPKSTISLLKRLIGRRFDEPSFQEERALFPFDTSKGEKGEVLVNVRYHEEDLKLTAIQLLGMFLCHLKAMAAKATGSEISDCVIGIPAYFTDGQRRDVLTAAEIAGLKTLRLFHDGAATAMDYGMYRNLPYAEEINVVFVDVGHCDTQVTVVKFNQGMATVLAYSFDRDLGGRDFDNVIFEHIVEKFLQQHKINVRENPKACFRLRTACEKAKRILSSNAEAQISIECLMSEIDLEDMVTREEFEEWSSSLLDRILITCEKALYDSGLLQNDIQSVELVGSGSRIPKISLILKKYFNQNMSRTLNGAECVANGCALQCGMLSSVLKNARYAVHDILPFSISGNIPDANSLKPSVSIAKSRFLMSAEVLILHPSQTVTLSYAYSKELPRDVPLTFKTYKIDSVDVNMKGQMEIRIQFNLNGIVVAQSAFLINKAVAFSNLANSFPEEKIDGIKGRHPLKISEFICGTTTLSIIQRAISLENNLVEQDRANERAKNQRNSLETSIFKMRNELAMLMGTSTNCDSISKMLNDIEDWLSGPGADKSESFYIEKMGELDLVQTSIKEEHQNAIARAEEKKKLLEYLYYHKIRRALSGRLQLFLKEHDIILKMIHEIESIVNDDNIVSEAYYTKKMEELNSLIDPIQRQYMTAQLSYHETQYMRLQTSRNVPYLPHGGNQLPLAMVEDQGSEGTDRKNVVSKMNHAPKSASNLYARSDVETEKILDPSPKNSLVATEHPLDKNVTLDMGLNNLADSSPHDPQSAMLTEDAEHASEKSCINENGVDRFVPRSEGCSTVEGENKPLQNPASLLSQSILTCNLPDYMSRLMQQKLACMVEKDEYIVIKGRPCIVSDVSTVSLDVNHPDMCHIVGIDVFNGEKVENTVCLSQSCDVPTITHTDYHLIHISEAGFAGLFHDSGHFKTIWLRTDDVLLRYMEDRLRKFDIIATVISAIGEEQICSFKYKHPKLDKLQLVGSLCINSFVNIDKRACMVVEVCPLQFGKFGPIYCRIHGIDIFSGEKLQVDAHVYQYLYVPLVSRTNYFLKYIPRSGNSTLVDEFGNKRNISFTPDKTLSDWIKDRFTKGKHLTVTIMSGMGEEKICSFWDDHPTLECLQLASTIQKNSHIVIAGRPCKVVDIGSFKQAYVYTKLRFVGIDIFTQKQLQYDVTPSQYCDVPRVSRDDYWLLGISPGGQASLRLHSPNPRDLSLPLNEVHINEIIPRISDGRTNVLVKVLSSMGEASVYSIKYIPCT